MTRLFIIVVLLLCRTILVNGQIVEGRVEKFIHTNNIDSSTVYSFPCSAYIYDSCYWEPTCYLIWKTQADYFIKRFDNCQNFKPILIDTINPFQFYFRNRKSIDKEEIKEPTYIEIRKTIKRLDTLLVTSIGASHSCHHKITFNMKTKSKTKRAYSENLNFIKFDNGKRNIYYSANQRTKFKALIDKFSELVKLLDTAKEFEVE